MPSQGENAAPGQVAISGHLPEMPTPSQFTPPYIDAEWREEGNAQAPKPMLNATKLLTGFKQRWRSAVLVGLVLGIIAGVVTWFLVPSRYTAFAYLEVSNEDPQIIPDKNRSSQTDKTYQNTQAQIVKSHPILLKALQDPKVRNLSIVHDNSDPIGWIEEEITATYPENTNLLKVSLSGMEPEELAILVNAITRTYLDQHINAGRAEKRMQKNNLDNIILKKEDEFRKKREELAVLATALRTSDTTVLTAKQKAVLADYESLQKQYTAILTSKWTEEAKLEAAEIELKALTTGTRKVSEEAIDQALEQDNSVKIKIQEVERQLDSARGSAEKLTEGSVLGKKTAGGVEEAKASLQELRKRRRPDVAHQVYVKALNDLDKSIQDHKQKIKGQELESGKVKIELGKREDEAERLGLQSAELKMKRAELDNVELTLKSLREQHNKLSVEIDSEKHRVTELQKAEPPDHLIRKKQISGAALSGICFLFLGMFGITYLDVRERKISTPNDVVQDLGLRVVGVFPSMDRGRPPRKLRSGIPEGEFWDTILNESIDSIRTMLLKGGEAESPRILMVTSAMPREGKTTLATQLATSIARTGSKTLLIDFDLRHPMVHEIFDVPIEPGLAEVLRGKVPLADAVRTTPLVPGLCILPVGAKARQLVPFLSQGGVPALLNALRPLYEFIVIDASPVLPVADSLLVGQHVDGVVFSIRPHFSQQPNIEAAYERLRAMHIRVVGAVVNGVAATLSPYEYRYLSSSTT